MARDPSPHSDVLGPKLDDALAERLRRAAGAAHELSDVLWEALHEELRERSGAGPRAQRVSELSQRLVDVAATVSVVGSPFGRAPASAEPEVTAPSAETAEPETAAGSQLAREPRFERPSSGSPSVAIIVDEWHDPPPAANPTVKTEKSETSQAHAETLQARAETSQAHAEMSPAHARVQPRPLPWDTPLSEELRATRSGERPVSVAPEGQ